MEVPSCAADISGDTVCMIFVLGLAWACGRPAAAGPAQEMLPEQSAAKAKQVLQQVIAALGGQAYLNVRDTQCDGRAAQFGTAGTLTGFTLFRDLWLLPDKNRVEYFTKGEHTIAGFLMGADDLLITHGGAMINIYTGDGGWTLDKSGVSDEPEDVIKNFNDRDKIRNEHHAARAHERTRTWKCNMAGRT